MNLKISDIVNCVGGEAHVREGDLAYEVSGVVLDSRKTTVGGVFLATVGERVDGHSFISEVFSRGVSLVITQKTPEQVARECGVDTEHWGNYILVPDTLSALKDIAECYRKKLTIPIVGVTGSVGKTSTKEFIAGVLEQKFQVLKTEGNYNNEIGVPLTLLSIRPEHTAAVVEMGISEFGEMHRLSKMARPDICVITNIGQCHLENLRNREGILQAKTEIMDYMNPDGEVCLWGEDDLLCQLRTVVKGKAREEGAKEGHPHYFGIGATLSAAEERIGEAADGVSGDETDAGKEVWAESIRSQGLLGSDVVLCRRDEDGWISRYFVHIPLPGKHMVINGTAAACVAGLLGLSPEEITRGLISLKSTQGRGRLHHLGGRVVIDDCYNANPVSMKASLDLLALAEGQRTAILGDMFELGENAESMHAQVGAYAAESGADVILCVGKLSARMYDTAVEKAQELFAAGGSREQRIYWFENLEKLMEELESREEEYLPRGCNILLKASHGMHFEQILEWLQKKPD